MERGREGERRREGGWEREREGRGGLHVKTLPCIVYYHNTISLQHNIIITSQHDIIKHIT